MRTAPLRILLADGHDVVRRGLRSLLEEAGWEICGEARTERELLRLTRDLAPDIAVIDLSLSEMSGAAAIRSLRQLTPATEVLVFTLAEDRQLIRQALAAGARGYLLKSDADRLIVTAIATIAEHKPFFTASVSEELLTEYLDAVATGRSVAPLTPRQREFLQLLGDDIPIDEIPALMSVTARSVRAVRASLMRKLGVRTQQQLLAYAIQHGVGKEGPAGRRPTGGKRRRRPAG